MSEANRKPHLLRVKRRIVALLDEEIERDQRTLASKDPSFRKEDSEIRRDLAIFIRQRNRIAKDAAVEEIPVTGRDAQGKIIYEGEGK